MKNNEVEQILESIDKLLEPLHSMMDLLLTRSKSGPLGKYILTKEISPLAVNSIARLTKMSHLVQSLNEEKSKEDEEFIKVLEQKNAKLWKQENV